MAHKMHLRRNVMSANPGVPTCSTNPYIKGEAGGRSITNRRDTYRNIPQAHILHLDAWLEQPDAVRCMHCTDIGLVIRNRQRAEKGLPPVKDLRRVPA